MLSLDNSNPEMSATVLRLGLGTVWIAHALYKWFVFGIAGFAGWMGTQGLPEFMAWPVFLLELFGGLMILGGYYGRYVAIVLLPVLLVAAWIHWPNGWVHTSVGGGWEYPVFLVLASVAYIMLGEGRYALAKKKISE